VVQWVGVIIVGLGMVMWTGVMLMMIETTEGR
jgi:hypothetical protein